jgi:hypothetical protein
MRPITCTEVRKRLELVIRELEMLSRRSAQDVPAQMIWIHDVLDLANGIQQ